MSQIESSEPARDEPRFKVKISFPFMEHYYQHISIIAPGGEQRWGDVGFYFNDEIDECDLWVVYQSQSGLLKEETTRCPAGNTLLITREPPDILELPEAYTCQFGQVIAPDPKMKAKKLLFQQFGQIWHVEQSYDFLKTCPPPAKKSKLISAVTSAKADTEGHRIRLALLEKLKAHFGDQIDHFGRGVRHTSCKWDCVYNYKYHLTLENGAFDHYWTEKLCDAYLGYAVPLYVGCPNIDEYFSPNSMIKLDPSDPDACIRAIENAIDEDAYSRMLPAISKARMKILDDYNFYKMVAEICRSLPQSPKVPVQLKPQHAFSYSLPFRIRKKWKSIFG